MHFIKTTLVMLLTAVTFALFITVACAEVSLSYDDVPYENGPIFIKDGVTYVGARALIDMRCESSAEWDGESAVFTSDGLILTATVGENKIIANGKTIEASDCVKLVDGRVVVPVRALSAALGADVTYDAKSVRVSLKTTDNYIDSSLAYTGEDLYWLSRIINAESCDEPYIGKLLVGNVVINRTKDVEFPSSVYGVIFDSEYGIQFTPVANGSIYKDPCEECTDAARAVLSGAILSNKVTYFVNTDVSPGSWAEKNRNFIFKYGNHTFFD